MGKVSLFISVVIFILNKPDQITVSVWNLDFVNFYLRTGGRRIN